MHLYLFPGLGADERVFEYLDLSGFDCTIIQWSKPHGSEKIVEYARRIIAEQITETAGITLIPSGLVHIHGLSDRILPFRFIQNAIPILYGGHLMIVTLPKIINPILRHAINK